MSDLDDWLNAVCAEFGLEPTVPADVILDVARDVAHGVERPAAPMTTFLLGRAVEAGASLDDAAGRISRLAASWRPPGPQ